MGKKVSKDLMIKKLNSSGFPFEFHIRGLVNKKGIKTSSTRYFVDVNKSSKSFDLDLYGKIRFSSHSNSKAKAFVYTNFMLVGEVKSWEDYAINYFVNDIQEEETLLNFPNFSYMAQLSKICKGGTIEVRKLREFSQSDFAKNIKFESFIDKKIKGDSGNAPLFKVAGGLAEASNYFHSRRIEFVMKDDHSITCIFPIVVTKAKIYKAVLDGLKVTDLVEKNYFFYLHPCLDLDKVYLATKEYLYFPIIITNEGGLESVISLIKNLALQIDNEVKEIVMKRPSAVFHEMESFDRFISKLVIKLTSEPLS